jgi:hypothetical protein
MKEQEKDVGRLFPSKNTEKTSDVFFPLELL